MHSELSEYIYIQSQVINGGKIWGIFSQCNPLRFVMQSFTNEIPYPLHRHQ